MGVDKKITPCLGCIVEFMQDNVPMLAIVLEEQGERLRLYTRQHKETSLPAARLLPWLGPVLGAGLSRADKDAALDEAHALRTALAAKVAPLEVWEMAQGDMDKAPANWLAGLIWQEPDSHREAALGRALLGLKTHFRFSPPYFEIFSAEVVEARLAEAETLRKREALHKAGGDFFRLLWEVHCLRRERPRQEELPPAAIAEQLKALLFARIATPDEVESDTLWKQLIRGIPETAHTPLFLATAWGLLPEHYNALLDRAGFESGEAWAEAFSAERAALRENTEKAIAQLIQEQPCTLPFVSVDPGTTLDRDDAFFVQRLANGNFLATIAIACPALYWPFGSGFDKAVLRRATSLYLPEGNEHLLPAESGIDLFSLDKGLARPALLIEAELSPEGSLVRAEPRLAGVAIKANLTLRQTEAVLAAMPPELPLNTEETSKTLGPLAATPAGAYAPMLWDAYALGKALQAKRLEAGAVITERPDPEVELEQTEGRTLVRIVTPPATQRASLVVGELMILANSAIGAFAVAKEIPLLYRSQDVALPRECSGIWSAPHEISRVVRLLPPATLGMFPRRHAGLGITAYTPVTAPMRRYTDLANQGQIVHYLQTGQPRLDSPGLEEQLPIINTRLEAVSQVQRQRPRYWKLLFFKQQGDKSWWPAAVVEETDNFFTLALPWAQILLRGRRALFDEKTHTGMDVEIRIGKVHPLLNEITILEVREV